VTSPSLLGGLLLLGAPALAASFPSKSSDLSHVLSISTYSYPTFATGFSGLFWCEFMSIAALMCNFAAFARDLALLFSVHSSESS
jgi:hypothetical protein